jgi:VWFA-related protein
MIISVNRIFGVALAAGLVSVAATAQEPDQPQATFFAPVEVPLVSVEVFVSERDGRPVPGLSLEDFEIFEDGNPVTISHFYAAPGVIEPSTGDPPEDDDEWADTGPEQELYLVIFFDDTNLSRGRRQAAVDHLSGFLGSELPADLQVMLVRYDGGMHVEQSFSEETDEVITALGEIQGSASLSRRLDEDRILREIENSTSAASLSPQRSLDILEAAGYSLLQTIDSYAEQTVHRLRNGIANQKRLIRSLSGLRGRKAMLLVSDGVEARPGERLYRAWAQTFEDVPVFQLESKRTFLRASRHNLGRDFNDLARFANGHRVSIYTLSALGSGRARGMSAETRLMDEYGLAADQGMSEDLTMSYMAGITGGRPLVNSPALSEQLDTVSVELASYYSVAFEPTHVGDGKYHRLEVRVKRDDVRVRHREGYLDVPRSERMADLTMAAAVHGVADNPLGIALANGEITRRGDGTYLVPVIITVPIGGLVLIPAEEEHRGQISILLTVRDERGGLSAPQIREYPVPVPNAHLAAALSQQAGFTLRLAMRPGKQRIVVGVRDDIGRTESVTAIEVLVGDSAGVDG